MVDAIDSLVLFSVMLNTYRLHCLFHGCSCGIGSIFSRMKVEGINRAGTWMYRV